MGPGGGEDQELDPRPAVDHVENIEAITVFTECSEGFEAKQPKTLRTGAERSSDEPSAGKGDQTIAEGQEQGRVVGRRQGKDSNNGGRCSQEEPFRSALD